VSAPLRTLDIASSPHIRAGLGVDRIMFNVVLALLPVVAFAVYAFGLAALLGIAMATASCVLSEHLLCRLAGKPSTIGDWSVTITGLLYGLTLPPGLALWMVALGGFLGVAMAKFLFGGLGYNAFNPALVARAFLQAAFPGAMTTWMPAFDAERFTTLPASVLAAPFTRPVVDAMSGATPLARMKFEGEPTPGLDLLLGLTAGSSGETCALLILAGGFYLAARRMLDWRIPAAILGTVALASAAMHAIDPARYAPPGFMLGAGGLMLGAVFMATDMVASPISRLGVLLYGALIGTLVVVIRYWGGMPEGVMYAILLGNAVSPHLDRLIQPVAFGARDRPR
jgi:electron transport complex protein RnfD